MANIKLNGIVIAENNMGDYDKMLTILTPNYGKISCVAKGARRQQSALLAGTQLFCFGEYLMYKGTNTFHINSCETIEIFYNLRTDLDKLKYAIHINKIIQDVTGENENCYKILQLFLNTLYTISETDRDKDFVYLLEDSSEEIGRKFGLKVLEYYNHPNRDIAILKADLNKEYYPIEQILGGESKGLEDLYNRGLNTIKNKQV